MPVNFSKKIQSLLAGTCKAVYIEMVQINRCWFACNKQEMLSSATEYKLGENCSCNIFVLQRKSHTGQLGPLYPSLRLPHMWQIEVRGYTLPYGLLIFSSSNS